MASFGGGCGGGGSGVERNIETDDARRASSCCRAGAENKSSIHHGHDVSAKSPEPAAPIPLVELAVNVSNQEDLFKLDEALKRKGVKLVTSDLDASTIQVQFPDYRCEQQQQQRRRLVNDRQPILDVKSLQQYVERETGFLAVIKGVGHLASAVAELRPSPAAALSDGLPMMFGVVRLSQMENGACFVDGLIEHNGAAAPVLESPAVAQTDCRRQYSLAIHEFGDLSSDNFDSIGAPEIEIKVEEQAGEAATSSPSISIQRVVPHCDVARQIGKSIGLSLLADSREAHEHEHGAGTRRRILSAGVIARASTIEANKKQVCTCSGKTLWQERAERSGQQMATKDSK